MSIPKDLLPDKDGFKNDPFGYGAIAWYNLGVLNSYLGIDDRTTRDPSGNDLKTATLWATHAFALLEAGKAVLATEPDLSNLHIFTSGICHSQYHAVALMLIGLSVESQLKFVSIVVEGVEEYKSKEKSRRHHRLHELSEYIPDLSDKDKNILKLLTHFIYWAGKYPDPGQGRESEVAEIHDLSEKYEITAGNLFDLTGRISDSVEEIVKSKR